MVDLAETRDTQLVPTPDGTIPDLSGDIRPLIPTLGLRNYWYPAMKERHLPKRKPKQLSMMGEHIAFFRDGEGKPVALSDICPHRGARISEGHVHWPGTIACPYHGWVFDADGKNVAVLSEGPESKVCGKPGTEAKKYPTQVLKGVVFIWIGDAEPAPIEEDVPQEFFDDDNLVTVGVINWDCNWEVALENSMDSHVNYLHRDAWIIAGGGGNIPRGAQGEHPIFVGNGFGGDLMQSSMVRGSAPKFDTYPEFGWRWPKTNRRRLWGWIFRRTLRGAQRNIPMPASPRWCSGHHLPGMFRAEFAYDLYTRQVIAVEEHKTRLFYYHYTQPKNRVQRWWQIFLYYAIHRWVIEHQFSKQDNVVMNNQLYYTPEKLSGTDAEVIQWRKLVVTKHFGGRDAPFEFRNPDDIPPGDFPMSRLSIKALLSMTVSGKASAAPSAANGSGNRTDEAGASSEREQVAR